MTPPNTSDDEYEYTGEGVTGSLAKDADLSWQRRGQPIKGVPIPAKRWERARRHWIVFEGDPEPWDIYESDTALPSGEINVTLKRGNGQSRRIKNARVVHRALTDLDLEVRGIKPESGTDWFEISVGAA